MKIAIIYDSIESPGGGERITLILADALNADVITTDVRKEIIGGMDFKKVRVVSLGPCIKVPLFKQISASLKFVLCNCSDRYDFFIFCGNWAYYASKKHKPNMWYCLTPTRPFYDLYSTFLKRQPPIKREIFRLWVNVHRAISNYYVSHVENIVTISKNVQKRVKIYLGRDSKVIYPPIDTSLYKFIKYGDFWLSVNRLYPEKRIELQIEAFRSLKDEKLVIVGGYSKGDNIPSYLNKLFKNLPKNVKVLGEVVDKKTLTELYGKCKGFIATALDEDFGMSPLEAMSAGKPVVAVREGGFLESVINGITGKFVRPQPSDIVKAVKEISAMPERYRKACEERAKEFDTSRFIREIKEEIRRTYYER